MIYNPKRCPYNQLRNLKGHAIIYVTDRDGSMDRIRHLSKKPHRRWDAPNLFTRFCDWILLSHSDEPFQSSCFDGATFNSTIWDMKFYDQDEGLKIVHIEFYEGK